MEEIFFPREEHANLVIQYQIVSPETFAYKQHMMVFRHAHACAQHPPTFVTTIKEKEGMKLKENKWETWKSLAIGQETGN